MLPGCFGRDCLQQMAPKAGPVKRHPAGAEGMTRGLMCRHDSWASRNQERPEVSSGRLCRVKRILSPSKQESVEGEENRQAAQNSKKPL